MPGAGPGNHPPGMQVLLRKLSQTRYLAPRAWGTLHPRTHPFPLAFSRNFSIQTIGIPIALPCCLVFYMDGITHSSRSLIEMVLLILWDLSCKSKTSLTAFHRMTERLRLGGTSGVIWSIPLLRQGHLELLTQDSVQMAFE